MSRITLNSNIASLNAQRNFFVGTKKLTESYTRLSSGLRINRASDDAAGLAISENLKTDSKIFNQGIRNINDGISLISIADGALGEMTSIMTRLSELAEQASNGTLGSAQRQALDKEAQTLSKEYNRIARTTEFNGRKILDSDFGMLSLAAGGSANSLITSGLGGAIGDGTFTRVFTSTQIIDYYGSVTEDFDGDGIIDIVSGGTNSITFSRGRGDGTFGTGVSYSTPYAVNNSYGGDVNGDGIIDIVSSPGIGTTISVLLGNGNGSFKGAVSYALGVFNQAPGDVVIRDFNNDGVEDLAIAKFVGGMSVLFGNGDGTFKSLRDYDGGSGSVSLKNADFNNDGVTDLAMDDAFNGKVLIFLGNSNGTFKSSISYVAAIAGGDVGAIAIEDFNGDGEKDVLMKSNIGNVHVLFGNGNGTFKAGGSYTVNSAQYSVRTGDFNGDGIKDLLASGDPNSIDILIGNADGSFKSRYSVATSISIDAVNVRDFNNDGVVDILASSSAGSNILLGTKKDGASALQSFSLDTKYDAKLGLDYFRKTLNILAQHRGKIGAVESRLNTALSNLSQSTLSYQEATSRIVDADIAEESAKLVSGQIIQRSASSILAQANQQPRITLQLLNDVR